MKMLQSLRGVGGPTSYTSPATGDSPAVMKLVDKDSGAAGPRTAQVVAQKVVNLALQGGGTHGAFTWGVLDRLLEEERLSVEGITASSAGAVNPCPDHG